MARHWHGDGYSHEHDEKGPHSHDEEGETEKVADEAPSEDEAETIQEALEEDAAAKEEAASAIEHEQKAEELVEVAEEIHEAINKPEPESRKAKEFHVEQSAESEEEVQELEAVGGEGESLPPAEEGVAPPEPAGEKKKPRGQHFRMGR